MLAAVPAGIGLFFALLPKLAALSSAKSPGDIRFAAIRPIDLPEGERKSGRSPGGVSWSLDWLQGRVDDLMAWEHNPWKRPKPKGFGQHFFDLLYSKDPADQAKAAALRKKAQDLYKRVLERYPEFIVEMRNVAPERNGFLKWLELSERFQADPSRPEKDGAKTLGMPEGLRQFLAGKGPWNAAEARAWLATEKAFLEELRTISLLPERSVSGIDVHRYSFINMRLAKECGEMLMLEACLAAEDGNTAGALEAVQAAKGLADHLGKVETPSLIAVTVQLLLEFQIRSYTMAHVIPSLPEGQFEPEVWEKAIQADPVPPEDFVRIIKGEWNLGSQEFLLPILSDLEDPKYPQDPEAVIDYHASNSIALLKAYEGKSNLQDWNTVTPPPLADMSHLSRSSKDVTEMMFVGWRAWANGLERSQHSMGMTRAAFAIMRGEAPPVDPVRGLPYVWNPATRELSLPADPSFDQVKLKPVTVPAR
ncbi:hypothetical protein [Luteolibacter luteus]|uniref:Uncharacterized protein n=1 Tax=Luteolibacter luteus TaxID=2728835 RepID=A0A858RRK8_9BACT|nr:hypothetical protein [Luteolibacter luteus]QJE98573.1 hypothetical protein HHL09_23245 [Luteolibacter luteus]